MFSINFHRKACVSIKMDMPIQERTGKSLCFVVWMSVVLRVCVCVLHT